MLSTVQYSRIMNRANRRCEWVYVDGSRCANTMSLKIHHRTYDNYGHELDSDLTVFCPVHHVIADIIRKKKVGQRDDIIIEWLDGVMYKKGEKMDPVSWSKFIARWKREGLRWADDEDFGADCLQWFARLCHEHAPDDESSLLLELEGDDVTFMRYAVWRFQCQRLCFKMEIVEGWDPNEKGHFMDRIWADLQRMGN